jgi:GNAT superfamily N-acetyltransferase
VSAPVVREATRADVDALLELRVLMFEAMGTDPEPLAATAWRAAARDWFLDRVGTSGVRLVVAEVDGAVASCAVGEVTPHIPGPGTPNGSVGLISNVATFAPFRGRGLAAACTDDLLAWFAERTDVTRVDLFATEAGARVYAPRGFTTSRFPSMRRAVPRS